MNDQPEPSKEEITLSKIYELLGKQKDDNQKFDPIKRIEVLIANRDFWKQKWTEQHTTTGLAYWNGYQNGYDDKAMGHPATLMIGFRPKSIFEELIS